MYAFFYHWEVGRVNNISTYIDLEMEEAYVFLVDIYGVPAKSLFTGKTSGRNSKTRERKAEEVTDSQPL